MKTLRYVALVATVISLICIWCLAGSSVDVALSGATLDYGAPQDDVGVGCVEAPAPGHSIHVPNWLQCPSAAANAPRYSQSEEDQYLLDTFFLAKPNRGFFVELGALDGVRSSNSKFFEESLGWRGVLIEADPENYGRLLKNRPNAVTVHSAVCSTAKVVHWVANVPSDVRGIWEFAAPHFKQYFEYPETTEGLAKINCKPLGSILNMLKINKVDFLSLDVEGAELEVVQSIDFDEVSFCVVLVEADGPGKFMGDRDRTKDAAVVDLLVGKGFFLHSFHQRSNFLWNPACGFLPSTLNRYTRMKT